MGGCLTRILACLVLCGLWSTFSLSPAAEDSWKTKADMLTTRAFLATSAVNGKIYAIGGTRDEKTALSTVEEYDPATDTWTKKTDVPTARGALSTSVVDGKIHAIGGLTASVVCTSAVEEYDTGFVSETTVDAKGKLAAVWGDIKRGW